MKKLIAAAAVALPIFATTSAHAQDWAHGWYLSVLGGPSIDPHLTFASAPHSVNTGFNVGGRVGYSLGGVSPVSGFALELDTFYNQNDFAATQTRLGSASLMGNLVYRFDTGTPFGIYGGAGVGAVRSSFAGGGTDGAKTVLGWQAIGGVDYKLSNDMSLFTEYRYQNAHDIALGPEGRFGNTSNNVSIGLKFHL